MRKLMLLALAISTSAIVSGCAATTGNFCDLADPHRPSPQMAAAAQTSDKLWTVKHNANGTRLCGWRP